MAKRKCKGCGVDISHKHPNAKFHSRLCKDRYWNKKRFSNLIPEQVEVDNEYSEDPDPSWDAHKDSW